MTILFSWSDYLLSFCAMEGLTSLKPWLGEKNAALWSERQPEINATI
jgi:hypothetical protein